MCIEITESVIEAHQALIDGENRKQWLIDHPPDDERMRYGHTRMIDDQNLSINNARHRLYRLLELALRRTIEVEVFQRI